jgi:hypothetical protein
MSARPIGLGTAADDDPLRDSDPFSPEALRVAPDIGAIGVKREILTVPVRRPDK